MKRIALLTIICICLLGQVFAGVETTIASLKGNNIAASNSIVAIDHHYADMQSGPYSSWFGIKNSKAAVTLRFEDTEKLEYTGNWDITVQYDIEIKDANGNSTTYNNETLTVEYKTAAGYIDIDMREYPDAHWAKITIDDNTIPGVDINGSLSSPLPNDFILDLEIITERYYVLDASDYTGEFMGSQYLSGSNELELFWDYVEGAESYDVEWVFVDISDDPYSVGGVGHSFDFNNATRINTPNQMYRIPLAYPRGIIVFRFRAVGYTGTNYDERQEGEWSYVHGATDDTEDVISFWGGGNEYEQKFEWAGLESDMNWQYQATFAENGKRKDVITFADGSGRGRETVTLLNTDSTAIVAKTIYDYQGRPAMNVLPAPAETSIGINYYSNLTLDGTSDFYSAEDFDTDLLVNNPDAMDATQSDGAAWYFSTSNSTPEGINGNYVPDAGGFPYTRTVYYNDGTERIKEQYGVGADYEPGATDPHQTKYFYGVPTQVELDRLFGSEVGYAIQYKKNLVIDPNGQASVVYLDQNGRTIATALAGDSPDNLNDIDTRPNEIDFPEITADLTIFNQVEGNNAWNASHTFLVPVQGDYDFVYELTPDTACVNCASFCDTCEYDLHISLVNNGVPATSGSYNVITPIVHYGITMAQNPAEPVGKITFTVNNLDPGSYTIHKRLVIAEDTLQSILLDLEDAQTCITLNVADADCNPPCSTMCEELHTFIDDNGYVVYLEDDGTIAGVRDESDADSTNWVVISGTTNAIWGVMTDINICKANCDPLTDIVDPCTIKENLIQADMSPGGQYFDNLQDLGTTTYKIDSILNADVWNEATADSTYFGTAFSAGDGQRNWQWVRDNWEAQWVYDFDASVTVSTKTYDGMREFHPEWCIHDAYCNWRCIKENEYDFDSDDLYNYFLSMWDEDNNDAWDDETDPLCNPLNMGEDDTYTTPSAYQPFDAGHSFGTTPPEPDPLFYHDCVDNDGCVQNYLQNYIDLTGSGTTYGSIWYLIDDPDGLAYDNGNSDLSGTLDSDAEAVFDYLHGNAGASPTISALIGTGTNQISEYEFFRSAYAMLREKALYDHANGTCPGGFIDPATTEAMVYYPQLEFFEDWVLNDNGTCKVDNFDFMAQDVEDDCDDICTDVADLWLQDYAGCYDTNDEAAFKADLIEICQLGCAFELPSGSSDGDLGRIPRTSITVTINSNNYTCFDFEDVATAYHDENCSTCSDCPDVEHPEPDYDQNTCTCENFQAFIDGFVGDGTTGNTLSSLTTQEQTEIVEDYNDLRNSTETTAYVWDDLTDFETGCAGTPPDPGTASPSGLTMVGAIECGTSQAAPDVLDPTEWETECDENADSLAYYNAMQVYNNSIDSLLEVYETNYRSKCLDETLLASRETFTMTWTQKEYHYTLYYYDQADNLVKTVPPAGVRIIPQTAPGSDPYNGIKVSDVQDHRGDPDTEPYIQTEHRMITAYRYNSLQQLTVQSTPDGGVTKFWYDALGRLIVSQNAKQQPKSQYSYTIYDPLGRVIEVGQLYNSTAMTYDISRGKAIGAVENYDDWLAVATNFRQVTHTYYEEPLNTTINTEFGTDGQQNLRNRIATVTYEYADDNNDNTYDYATHYSYDPHGNVSVLLQEFPELADMDQDFKRIEYYYDLVSGNVNEVHYQPGDYDEFYHRYCYDADNRVTAVYTSGDNRIWKKDQKYFYYAHGPLARVETGDMQVQANDYTYTIQGWMKGMNSNTLYDNRDPGNDSEVPGSGENLNEFFATDGVGFTLGYYLGDYTPITTIGTTDNFEASINPAHNLFGQNQSSLYNGNIGHMVTAIRDENKTTTPQAMVYQYDQLNRLVNAESTTDMTIANNSWDHPYVYTNAYELDLEYDANGNITSLDRMGDNIAYGMDELTYTYLDDSETDYDPTNPSQTAYITNRLSFVDDVITSTNYTTDIDDQATGNYEYDEIGQLTKDVLEEIENISWTVRNKINTINRISTSNMSDLAFSYDAMGNRVVKVEMPRNGSTVKDQDEWTYTYYVRDAQGNILATYERTFTDQTTYWDDNLTIQEHNIFGNKRVGFDGTETTVTGAFNANMVGGEFDTASIGSYSAPTNILADHTDGSVYIYDRELGNKSYESSNHLGNVLMVYSDIKRPASATGGVVDFYEPNLLIYNDFYPFGMTMPGRTYTTQAYRYGFQAQEEYPEFWGGAVSYKYRVEDPRVGRFFSVDPLFTKYPHYSPYHFSSNQPIHAPEYEGLESSDDIANGSYILTDHGAYLSGFPDFQGYDTPIDNRNSYDRAADEAWERGDYDDWIYYKARSWDQESYDEIPEPVDVAMSIFFPPKDFIEGVTIVATGEDFEGTETAEGWGVLYMATAIIPGPDGWGGVFKKVAKNVDLGKQGKHIPGHNNYATEVANNRTPSILSGDSQKLLDEFHSGNVVAAQQIDDVKFRVKFNEPIGTWINAAGEEIETSVGIIHNSSSGAHIVPANPDFVY